MTNVPILILLIMTAALLYWPTRMMTTTAVSALAILVASGVHAPEVLQKVAPNFVTVLMVMSATQLAVKRILQAGAAEYISVLLAKATAHRWLRYLPAEILLPAIFVPASMVLASILHNITAIAILVPLVLGVCVRYGTNPGAALNAILIGSNLGGASMAFGDTPAIIQRENWHFTPGQFAAAMLPRNIVILAILTATACIVTWLPVRGNKTDWRNILNRLRTRDDISREVRYKLGNHRAQALVGGAVLVGFIVFQFLFPRNTLVLSSAAFLILVLLTPEQNRKEALSILGLDSIVVIGALFVIATGVESTPFVQQWMSRVGPHSRPGAIEGIAYLLTAGISADGAAAMLAPVVHAASGGTMLSAWQLASGICAGSSVFLTSASAGPILYGVARVSGFDLTFRAYARFGVPFSLLMVIIYIALNRIFAL